MHEFDSVFDYLVLTQYCAAQLLLTLWWSLPFRKHLCLLCIASLRLFSLSSNFCCSIELLLSPLLPPLITLADCLFPVTFLTIWALQLFTGPSHLPETSFLWCVCVYVCVVL